MDSLGLNSPLTSDYFFTAFTDIWVLAMFIGIMLTVGSFFSGYIVTISSKFFRMLSR